MDFNTTFTETFDVKKLELIVKYKEHFSNIIRDKLEESGQDVVDKTFDHFILCERYLLSACGTFNNTVIVNYRKKYNRGRLFADGSVSLQNMPKLIRGTIAKEFYYDIDMVNAHPVILKQICKNNKFKTMFLNMYIEDRDTVINEIIEYNDSLLFNQVKRNILSLIYGGKCDIDIVNKTDWLIGFSKEMKKLHKEISTWFPNEYNLQCSVKGKEYYNLTGATLSSSICVVENDLLQIMISYLKEKKHIVRNAVLCFDGIMIPRGKIDDIKLIDIIADVEKLFAIYGYSVLLKEKEFSCLKLNDLPYLETKEDEKINLNDAKDLYRDSEYYWYDFMKDMNMFHSSLSHLHKVFIDNINKVMLRVYEMDDIYVKKISRNNLYQFDKKIPIDVFTFWSVNAKGEPILKNVSFKELLTKLGYIKYINCYDKLDFRPFSTFEDEYKEEPRVFNTWTGFQAKLVDDVHMDLVEPILNHIKRVWCSDNEYHFNYFLAWFKLIFTNPSFKSKVAIVLKSSDKQIGKGILINDFLIPFVFGEHYSMSIAGLDTITTRFNQILMNKLFINCDELSTLTGSYHQSFDVMKKRITDKTCKIEIKGGASFIYPDFSNYILCTNNDFTVRVEQGDVRYLILDCSPVYKGDYNYFNNLSKSLNQESANHFFTYICNHNTGINDIRDIPMTDIKREMMINSLSNSLRFLMDIKEMFNKFNENYYVNIVNYECISCGDLIIDCISNDTQNRCGKCHIIGSNLYLAYIAWCNFNNETKFTSTKFGRDIKDSITKIRSNGMVYKLNTINIIL